MSKLSYVVGTGEAPLLYSDIPSLLDEAAENIPEKAAHVFRFMEETKGTQELTRTVITFRDLAERSLAVAAAFLDMGLKPGDTIAILGGNCPQYIYVDYACLRIKLIMIRVPVNFCHETTLMEIISKYECKGLVVDGFVARHLESFIGDFLGGELPNEKAEKVKTLTKIFNMSKRSDDTNLFADLINIDELALFAGDKSAVRSIQKTIDPEEIAIIWPTSGSTGEPKFVAHTNFSFLNSLKSVLTAMNCADSDTVYFNDRSFGWVGSFVYGAVVCKMTMLYLDNRATVGGQGFNLVYRVMNEEKVTAAWMMPYLLFDAMKAKEESVQKPVTLKYVITGGERIPAPLINFARQEFTSVMVLYGSTEVGFSSRGSICSDVATGSLSQLTTSPRYEIKITDDTGQVTARGVPGQILARSILGFTRYLKNKEASEKVRSTDGWTNSGDIGIMTSDGLLEIVGRSKDIISRGKLHLGTTKIYPKVVEDILLKCPGVQKAIVVGVPDPRLYQELCACIIPVPGHTLDESHLREFYNTHMLGVSCAPRYYQMMTEFPQGNTGKFDMKILASHVAAKLGLQE